MRLLNFPSRFALAAAGLFLFAGILAAGEKKLMHCFAFTPLPNATEADFDAFYKATDALPGKIQGLSRVWYGKLRAPLAIFSTDAKARKELSGGAKTATGEVTRVVRSYGVCMEFDNEGALTKYAADPAHKEWVDVYSKVRVAGTTTYDILGQ